MPGAPDPLYVAARCALLDALEAMRAHLDSVIVVGAQAVYIHTGEAELAVAPYTTDSDLALDPTLLGPKPLIEDLLTSAHFRPSASDVGAWTKEMLVDGYPRQMVVDLLVPQSIGGAGRRAARIAPHGKRVARKVAGLEGILIDKDIHEIASLDTTDTRTHRVAGRRSRRFARRQALQDCRTIWRDDAPKR